MIEIIIYNFACHNHYNNLIHTIMAQQSIKLALPTSLREKAELLLNARQSPANIEITEANFLKLAHELELCLIEFELQEKELALMKKNASEEEVHPEFTEESLLNYYNSLDYQKKVLFKKEIMNKLEWSPHTFHRRFADGKFKNSCLIIIALIIESQSYLKNFIAGNVGLHTLNIPDLLDLLQITSTL